MWYCFEKPLKICCPFHPKAHKPENYHFLDWNLCKISNDFQWKWKGYIVNWVTRYQCYEMVFGDNQVCLPAFQFVCSRFKTQLRPAAAGGVRVGRRKIWPVWLHGVGCYDGNNILFVSIWHPDYRPCWSRHNFIPLHNKFRVIEFYSLIKSK